MRAVVIFACVLSLEIISATNIDKMTELQNLNSSTESPVSEMKPPSSTSEVSLAPCHPDKSLHTKEDIKILINSRVKTLAIYNFINDSYYFQAVAVRDKHINDFNHFRNWHQNRHEHLKHNVEDIAFVRGHVEPFVKRVAHSIIQYTQLQEKYDKSLSITNTLLRNLNRYKIICENNCDIKNLFRTSYISRRSGFNGYHCSSLEDLDQSIKTNLIEFAKHLSSTMLNRVIHDDKVFTKNIYVLKNKLKDDALKEFGKTMYDILNLQDEYYHFIQDLIRIDANSEVYKIKQTNLHIDRKLLELEQRIESYGAYCRICNEITLRFISKKSNKRITFDGKEIKSQDLVEDLLTYKHTVIENSINNDYSNIFKELNSLLNNTDSQDIYLTDLKPIQDEIEEMLKIQRTKFDELKSIAAPASVTKLIKLSSDTKQLLSNIDEELDKLNKIWPK